METVGVGQSETTVRSMVDFFLAVVLTGAGDDLQGIKKGLLELVDGIFVNKADGDNVQPAMMTAADYNQVMHYLRPSTEGWTTKAYTCSARTGDGVREMWGVVEDFWQKMTESGVLQDRRRQQNLTWVRDMTDEYFRNLLYNEPTIQAQRQLIEENVLNGTVAPTRALREIIQVIEQRLHIVE